MSSIMRRSFASGSSKIVMNHSTVTREAAALARIADGCDMVSKVICCNMSHNGHTNFPRLSFKPMRGGWRVDVIKGRRQIVLIWTNKPEETRKYLEERWRP